MSVPTIVTGGYGSFGSIPEIVLMGYLVGVVPPPSAIDDLTSTDQIPAPVDFVMAQIDRRKKRLIRRIGRDVMGKGPWRKPDD